MNNNLVIIGLGNPTKEHKNNRHNAGWLALNALEKAYCGKFVQVHQDQLSIIKKAVIDNQNLFLLYPQTYMNTSGKALSSLDHIAAAHQGQILVVHDDLDLPLGRLRLKNSGTPGGHNGVKSIAEVLQTLDFMRLKIGISRPQDGLSTIDYALSSFKKEELPTLQQTLRACVKAIEILITEGWDKAIQQVNSKNFVLENIQQSPSIAALR